jgi:hypothetical protein
MHTKSILLFTALFWTAISCSTSRNTGKEVENETREKLKYAVVTQASGDGYTLHLRENAFFDFQGKGPTETHSNLYAGTWERRADSLFLAFHSNYQPEDLTGTGKFDRANNLIILFSKDISRHRKLVIEK